MKQHTLSISTLKTRGSVDRVCVAHLSFCFEDSLYNILHRCFLPNFDLFGQMVLEKIGIWKFCTGSPIHHSYKVTLIRTEKKFKPHLLKVNRNMSHFY